MKRWAVIAISVLLAGAARTEPAPIAADGACPSRDCDAPNPEMKAIFDADQNDRAGKVDAAMVVKSDIARRARTHALLDTGALHTGEDFEEASFVFQHGGMPDDYLLAHTLALIAVSKGDRHAVWIAAATLDRYLQHIGRKQIFGTQFVLPSEEQGWTQEPYDRALVSDALRRQLGVPPMADQAKGFQPPP